MSKIKISLGIIFIILGIAFILYPQITNMIYKKEVSNSEIEFSLKTNKDENKDIFDSLYNKLQELNEELYNTNQKDLKDPFSYEKNDLDLSEYGIEDNIIAYLKIEKLNLILPIRLGANSENMTKGAVHLTGTSYPIGGINTNTVIAAHRGYAKTQMFRNLDKLVVGDIVSIENFKETINYRVKEIKIINPDEINTIYIQEGQDLLTLITCHPYRVNTQRLVVICERI